MTTPEGGKAHAVAALPTEAPAAVSGGLASLQSGGNNGSSLSVPSQISTPSVDAVDRNWDDSDSAVDGLSIISSTTSLRPSFYEHVKEYGRTYHRYKEGKYPLPNDEQEQDRLDLQHAIFGVTLSGKLHLAPLPEQLGNVLDIATGTGIWAIEFANQYPSATVTGTDLSAIQPEFVPPNVSFEIDDAEDEWIFNKKFDYIHGRALLSCFKEPSEIIRKAFDNLAPGGLLELQDGVFPFLCVDEEPKDSAFFRWSRECTAGAAKSGRPWTNAQHYKRWMQEYGFEDVVEKRYYWPTSQWAKGRYFKEIALYFQEDLLSGVEGISTKVLASNGWSQEELQVFLPQVKSDIKNKDIHAYLPIVFVYGRKPLA